MRCQLVLGTIVFDVRDLEDHEGLAAWAAVLQTHAFVVEALERELAARRHLPLTWFEVLLRLSEASDGRMRMQDLARLAWLSKSGITRLVDRMETAGFVSRCACDHDRRVTYASITPAGRRAARAAAPLHLAAVERYFARHLSLDEQRLLRALLLKILRANGQASQGCESAAEKTAAART